MSVSGIVTRYSQGYSQPVPNTGMWPFSKKRSLDSDARSEIVRKLLDLDARLSELEGKHMSLRGKVYGAGIHKKPLPDSEEERRETIPRSKDELRKIAGIRAGKPYPHNDDPH